MKPKLRKELIFILLILILIGVFSTSVFLDRKVVFKDHNFELAIRQSLNYANKPIYRSQLLDITELDLSGREIKNIEGIQYFRNLRTLNLRYNNLTDVGPLGTLSNLRILDLGFNHLINLEDANVGQLKNLNVEELNLDHNVVLDGDQVKVRLSDIDLLAEFTSLEVLSLVDNHITDITPLAGLSKLRKLNLRENKLKNLSCLEGLHNLEALNLRENQINEISFIGKLNNLRYLNLHSNENIEDLSPIANLTGLETLILRGITVGNQIEVLRGLTSLKRLNLRNCDVDDFTVLFDLMSVGALQDNPDDDIFAYLDIMENPIPNNPHHLRGFRPYWDNIATKYPLLINDSILRSPEFSTKSGFFQEPFFLSLSTNEKGASIYYTLDGSTPTLNSNKYSMPISINTGEVDQNGMMKGTVVRARVFQDDGFDASPTVTHTYFVNEKSQEIFSLAVVSLVVDPAYLFDPEIGIYQNFRERGKKWERPIDLTLFENNEKATFNQFALVRINGSVTRQLFQKSFRFYADNTYRPNETFNYEFFPGYTARGTREHLNEFSTFLLRNAGNDHLYTFFKDAMVQSLVSHTKLDIQAYRPVNVFINGMYWGILNLRERTDEFYLANHYGFSPEDVLIYDIDFRNGIFNQSNSDNEYLQMLENIKHSTVDDLTLFTEIKSMIDIENFIDNQIIYLYSANADWLDNNTRVWKMKTKETDSATQIGHDGLWRWIVFDMDHAFNLSMIDFNMFELKERETQENILLDVLSKNSKFLNQFINRFADHLNTSFLPCRVVEVIERIKNNLETDMTFHITRWKHTRFTLEEWNENVVSIKTFANKRPDYVRQHIMEQFDLDGVYTLTVKTTPEQGFVRVNSIEILPSTPGVEDPSCWSGIYFNDLPLTLIAFPNQGFKFSHWENPQGEIISYESEIVISPISDTSLTAIFVIDSQ